MTEIEKAKAVWRICANPAIPLSGSDRAQIANSFKAMIELAEQAEGFEAFKREVSDAAVEYNEHGSPIAWTGFDRFIIAKPDPLVEALLEISGEGGYDNFDHYAYRLRSALEARGLELREIEP